MNKKLLFLIAISLTFSSCIFAASARRTKGKIRRTFPVSYAKVTAKEPIPAVKMPQLSAEAQKAVDGTKIIFDTDGFIVNTSLKTPSWATMADEADASSGDEEDKTPSASPTPLPVPPVTMSELVQAIGGFKTDSDDELTDCEDGSIAYYNPEAAFGPELPVAGSIEDVQRELEQLESPDVPRTEVTIGQINALVALKLHLETKAKADELRDQLEKTEGEYKAKIDSAKVAAKDIVYEKTGMTTQEFIAKEKAKGTTTTDEMLSNVAISTAHLPGPFKHTIATTNQLVIPSAIVSEDDTARDAASPEGDLIEVAKTHDVRLQEINRKKIVAAEATSAHIAAQHTTRTGKSSDSYNALMGHLSKVLEKNGATLLSYVQTLPHGILFGGSQYDKPAQIVMDDAGNVQTLPVEFNPVRTRDFTAKQEVRETEKDERHRPALLVTKDDLNLAIAHRALAHQQRSKAKDDEEVTVKLPQTLAETLSALTGTKVEDTDATTLFKVMRDDSSSLLYYNLEEVGSNVSDQYKLESAHKSLVRIRTTTKKVKKQLEDTNDPREKAFKEARTKFVKDLNEFEDKNGLRSSQGVGTQIAGALTALNPWG